MSFYEDGRWEYVQDVQEESSRAPQEYDFRQVYWGASKEQVKASESTELIEMDNDCLECDVKIKGINAHLFYFFVLNKLVRAMYLIIPEKNSHNINQFYSPLNELKDSLTIKYGKLTYEKKYNISSKFKYSAEWKTEKMVVLLIEEKNSSIIIEYDSKELDSFAKKNANQESIINL